jgi:hypothetical protein
LVIDGVAAGRKARAGEAGRRSGQADEEASRHIPDAIKRAVWERDSGRCAFIDARGQRCSQTAFLQLDHVDGFARDRVHCVDRIRLARAAHNQHAAEKMYGKSFMDAKRASAARRRGAAPPAGTFAATGETEVEARQSGRACAGPDVALRADGESRPMGAGQGRQGATDRGKTPQTDEEARLGTAYGALRHLGFRVGESRRAIAVVRSRLQRGASLEQIERLALRVLTDGPDVVSSRSSPEPPCSAP